MDHDWVQRCGGGGDGENRHRGNDCGSCSWGGSQNEDLNKEQRGAFSGFIFQHSRITTLTAREKTRKKKHHCCCCTCVHSLWVLHMLFHMFYFIPGLLAKNRKIYYTNSWELMNGDVVAQRGALPSYSSRLPGSSELFFFLYLGFLLPSKNMTCIPPLIVNQHVSHPTSYPVFLR